MWRRKHLLLPLIVSAALLLAACQPAAQETPSSPPPPTATATPHPSPTPRPSPTATAPSPTPRPASPTPTPPLAPLPQNTSFVWGKAFPAPQGNPDDLQALQDALRISMKYESDVWVASWPARFPTELPLPQQGWLVFAAYSPYGADQGSWRLGFEIPAAAQAWQEAFASALEKAGWRRAPQHGPAEWEPSGGTWCNAALTWALDISAVAMDDAHAVGIVAYQSTMPEASECAASPLPTAPLPPKGFPVLKGPHGEALFDQGGGASPGEWENAAIAHSPQGIAPLMQGFVQQLTDQGWHVQSTAAGGIGDAEAGFVRASKEDHQWPRLAVLVLGRAPDFHVWLWGGKIPKAPVVFEEGHLPVLHGRLDDVATLRRALALAQQPIYPNVPAQNWVAAPPSPWPLNTLPRPRQAQWKLALHARYPHGDDHWMLTFVLPKSPTQARADLRALLRPRGWMLLEMPQNGDASLGFLSPPPPPEQQADMFCYGNDVYLTANYVTYKTQNDTLGTWEFSSQADICRYNHGTAPDMVPPFSGPHVLLQIPQGDSLSSGGIIPSQLGFANGYSVTSTWWASKPLADEIADFAAQMQQQGWQIAGRDTLGEDAAWLHATRKMGLFHWRADVLVGLIGDRYVYGVLWAQRGK